MSNEFAVQNTGRWIWLGVIGSVGAACLRLPWSPVADPHRTPYTVGSIAPPHHPAKPLFCHQTVPCPTDIHNNSTSIHIHCFTIHPHPLRHSLTAIPPLDHLSSTAASASHTPRPAPHFPRACAPTSPSHCYPRDATRRARTINTTLTLPCVHCSPSRLHLILASSTLLSRGPHRNASSTPPPSSARVSTWPPRARSRPHQCPLV